MGADWVVLSFFEEFQKPGSIKITGLSKDCRLGAMMTVAVASVLACLALRTTVYTYIIMSS